MWSATRGSCSGLRVARLKSHTRNSELGLRMSLPRRGVPTFYSSPVDRIDMYTLLFTGASHLPQSSHFSQAVQILVGEFVKTSPGEILAWP